MRSRTRACLAIVAVVTAGLLAWPSGGGARASGRVIDGRVDDWIGVTSGIGGSTQWSRGELIYQDHIYDDLGPDTGVRARQHGTVGAPAGDYRYPDDEGRYGHNAADLLELRFAVDDTFLYVLARLNTLKAEDATVVAVGFDTPLAGELGAWPHAAGIAASGVDTVVTLWGNGGSIVTTEGSGPQGVTSSRVNTSDEHNAIEAAIPLHELGMQPDATDVGVWAATGLWNPQAAEWMPAAAQPSATEPGGGSPLVAARAWNVAFRAGETGSFFDEVQAAALAAGDISAFRGGLDLAALRAHAEVPAELVPGSFHAIVLDTGFAIGPGEGVSYDGIPGRFQGVRGAALSQKFSFFGRHQPYGLYVPTTHDGRTPAPAALVLHGLGGSHSSYNSGDGFLADMGEGDGAGSERPPLYLITPLARGSSFYADWGEAETLRVLDDVAARVPLDPDRLYLTGYSMGGYGVYRLASLHPDLFAAAAVWAGYSGEVSGGYLTEGLTGLNPDGGNSTMGKANIGDPVQTMENLRHLPLVLLSGTNDEIVPTPGQYAAVRRLDQLGYRSRWDVYPGYDHFAFGVVDDWTQVRRWLGDARRERSPRDITYRFSDAWTADELVTELGLPRGNAWWLRDVRMRETPADAFDLATAAAESYAIAANEMAVERPPALPVQSPTPHVQLAVEWHDRGVARDVANRLRLELSGVGSARVVLADAGLEICGLVLDVTTDGPVVIHLDGPGSSPDADRLVAYQDASTQSLTIDCQR